MGSDRPRRHRPGRGTARPSGPAPRAVRPTRRRTTRLTVALLLAVLAGGPVPGAPAWAWPGPPDRTIAVGDSPVTGPAPEDVAGAEAEARAAARRVDALRVEYVRLSDRAAAAATRLSAAFAEQSLVNGQHDADAAALARARTFRAASIRAAYASGGELGLLGSVLAATSADDALWRIGTARRIQAGVLRANQVQADAAQAGETRSRQALVDAERAETDLAQALTEFQNDVAAADTTMTRAQAELDRLTAQARRLAAARDAARRLAEARAAAEAARLASARVTALVIPPDYESVYRAAADTCTGLDWTLLAAVGQVESGHGRNNGPSSAGAIGPMQFMPATFAAYAVDGDQDGDTDVWDHHDAIFSAAAYLCASGARGGTDAGVRAALLAYNHAQWYVDLVLAARSAIAARENG